MSVTLNPAGGGVTINPAAPVSSDLSAQADRAAAAATSAAAAERRYKALEANLHRAGEVELYVDAGGDDNAAGTDAAPLQTLTAALRKAPPGGTLVVILKSDIAVNASVRCRARMVQLLSDGDDRRTLTIQAPNPLPDDPVRAGAYWIQMIDPDAVFFINNIEVDIGLSAAGLQEPAFMTGVGQLTLRAFNSRLRGRENGGGIALMSGAVAYALAIESSSVSNMAGHWISGVAPGTPKVDVANLLWSTVATL